MENKKIIFIDYYSLFTKNESPITLNPNVEETLREYHEAGYFIIGYTHSSIADGQENTDHLDREIRKTLSLFGAKTQVIRQVNISTHQATMEDKQFSRHSLGSMPFYGMIVKSELDLKHQGYLIDYDKSILVGNSSKHIFCAQKAKIRFSHDKYFFGWQPSLVNQKIITDTIAFLENHPEIKIFLRGFVETYGLFYDLNTEKLGKSVFSNRVYQKYYLPLQAHIQEKHAISSLDAVYETIIEALLFDFAYVS